MVSISCCEHVGLIPEGTNDLTSYVKDVGIHFGNKKVVSLLGLLSASILKESEFLLNTCS